MIAIDLCYVFLTPWPDWRNCMLRAIPFIAMRLITWLMDRI